MANYVHAATSRPPIKIVTAEQEEAGNELKLGEFQSTPTLSLSEARIIINAVVDRRHAEKKRFTETEYASPSSSCSNFPIYLSCAMCHFLA